jgi:hypothetical protein
MAQLLDCRPLGGDMPARAVRGLSRRCSGSGTLRIWIMLDMCKD